MGGSKKLIMFGHTCSCSTYFIKQFDRSPLLTLHDMNELITPKKRHITRRRLGLPDMNALSANNWDHDELYIDTCWEKTPNAAFKLLSHGHKMSLIKHIQQVHNPIIVTIQRKDHASTLASTVGKFIRQELYPEIRHKIWAIPSKEHDGLITYKNIPPGLVKTFPEDQTRKFIVNIYFGLLLRSFMYMDSIDTPYKFYTEDLGDGFTSPQLEDELQMDFDFSDYIEPSHYSETFEDWEYFRDDVRDILGDIPGL